MPINSMLILMSWINFKLTDLCSKDIFDIKMAGYVPKPESQTLYEKLVEKFDI